jgi:hypothetical protein
MVTERFLRRVSSSLRKGKTEAMADTICALGEPLDEFGDDELQAWKRKFQEGRYDSALSPSLQVQVDQLEKAITE